MRAGHRIEDFQQVHIVAEQGFQRDFVQMGVKRLRRIGQSQLESAMRNKRTGVVCIRKTLGDRQIPFHIAKDVTDANALCVARQRDAPIAPTLCSQITQLAQLVNHLCQMIFRDVANLCNLRFGDQPVTVGGTEHQQADSDIGSFGNAHEQVLSRPRWATLAQK